MCAKPFKLLFCFSVLCCPVSDSTFSPCPAYSVDNVFPFNFVRQTQGVLIPSPSPGEEQPTSGGHSRLEDLFWHSLLWNPTHVTFCLNTLCMHGRKGLCEGSQWSSLTPTSFWKCQTSRLQTFFPTRQLLFGLGLPSLKFSKSPLWKQK